MPTTSELYGGWMIIEGVTGLMDGFYTDRDYANVVLHGLRKDYPNMKFLLAHAEDEDWYIPDHLWMGSHLPDLIESRTP